jgi:hypothetical protein
MISSDMVGVFLISCLNALDCTIVVTLIAAKRHRVAKGSRSRSRSAQVSVR